MNISIFITGRMERKQINAVFAKVENLWPITNRKWSCNFDNLILSFYNHIQVDRLWSSVEALFPAVVKGSRIPQISTQQVALSTDSAQIEAKSTLNPNIVRSWVSDTNNRKREWRISNPGDDYRACTAEQSIADGIWDYSIQISSNKKGYPLGEKMCPRGLKRWR